MKKALLILGAIALVIWVVSWFRTPEAVATSASKPWPAGLGPLSAAAERLPPRDASRAALELAVLAKTLPQTPIEDYVWREITRPELTIGEPPAIPDLTAIRDLLLREKIVWERTGGIGEIGGQETSARRVVQVTVARAFVASALAKAKANDASAWDDLRAVWNLAQSLEGQPEMMEQTAALSMVRMVNAVAWKMPLPVPEWFAALQQRDDLRPLLESFHYQAASYWESGNAMFPTKFLANSVEHDRAIAEQIVGLTACDVTVPMNGLGVDLSTVWRRAFRYRAEQEATANALRVREGKPIVEKSVCSDGSWSFDGTTLRFSRDIEMPEREKPMPLALQLKR